MRQLSPDADFMLVSYYAVCCGRWDGLSDHLANRNTQEYSASLHALVRLARDAVADRIDRHPFAEAYLVFCGARLQHARRQQRRLLPAEPGDAFLPPHHRTAGGVEPFRPAGFLENSLPLGDRQ